MSTVFPALAAFCCAALCSEIQPDFFSVFMLAYLEYHFPQLPCVALPDDPKLALPIATVWGASHLESAAEGLTGPEDGVLVMLCLEMLEMMELEMQEMVELEFVLFVHPEIVVALGMEIKVMKLLELQEPHERLEHQEHQELRERHGPHELHGPHKPLCAVALTQDAHEEDFYLENICVSALAVSSLSPETIFGPHDAVALNQDEQEDLNLQNVWVFTMELLVFLRKRDLDIMMQLLTFEKNKRI